MIRKWHYEAHYMKANIELRLDRRSRDVMMAIAGAAIDWNREHSTVNGVRWGETPGAMVDPDHTEERVRRYWGGVHLSLGGPGGGMPVR